MLKTIMEDVGSIVENDSRSINIQDSIFVQNIVRAIWKFIFRNILLCILSQINTGKSQIQIVITIPHGSFLAIRAPENALMSS